MLAIKVRKHLFLSDHDAKGFFLGTEKKMLSWEYVSVLQII